MFQATPRASSRALRKSVSLTGSARYLESDSGESRSADSPLTDSDGEEWIRIGRARDLPAGHSVRVDVEGIRIALFNDDDTYRAVDDFCLHQGGPLSEGTVEGGVVTCPWHRWRYDLASGQRVDRTGSRIRVYPVRVSGGWIVIGL
jgi:nitrite reductase (NADH) small subunit